jgi:hypothetical protein
VSDKKMTIWCKIWGKCDEMRQIKMFLVFVYLKFFRGILMKFSFTKIQLLIDRVVSSIYMNEILKALASVIILSFFA